MRGRQAATLSSSASWGYQRQPWGYTFMVSVSLCLGRKRRWLWPRNERNTETAEWQTDRQTRPAQHSLPCRVEVYLVCHSSRAFLPQPQGWGHVLQHLKHVIVTDAPTGDPAQWAEADRGPKEGRGGSRQNRSG